MKPEDGLAMGMADFIARSENFMPTGYYKDTLGTVRASYRELYEYWRRPRPEAVMVEDAKLTCGARKLAIRLYRLDLGRPQSLIFYLHGGGWILGDLDSHDDLCAELALESGATVVALDYPLAPEAPYPAAQDAAYDALLELCRHCKDFEVDPQRIVVAGDSAGGALAASIARRAVEEQGPTLRGQILIYPALGAEMLMEEGGGDAPLLDAEELAYYRHNYFAAGLPVGDVLAFPLLASSMVALPPAYILAAELDPLSLDAKLYHEALLSAGVKSRLEVLNGVVHGAVRARAHCPAVDLALTRLARAAADLFAAS